MVVSYIILMVNMMYENDLLTGLHVGSFMGQGGEQSNNNILTLKISL